MNAKEKAKELLDKHSKFQVYTIGQGSSSYDEFIRLERSRLSALITVEEIIRVGKEVGFLNPEEKDFWYGVQFELKKL